MAVEKWKMKYILLLILLVVSCHPALASKDDDVWRIGFANAHCTDKEGNKDKDCIKSTLELYDILSGK